MELSHFKWSGAGFHPLMLGVNQAVYTDLAHARKPGASLQACMQLVYSTVVFVSSSPTWKSLSHYSVYISVLSS